MWKSRREDERPQVPVSAPTIPASVAPTPVPAKEIKPMEAPKADNFRNDVAHIGKSVLVKGELSGSEDLYLDGEVEGSIELKGHSLTIGPHGRVKANVHARDVVVHGKVEGNVRGTERVELKKSAVLVGDIFTQRIVIEDGAFFKGGIDIQKDTKAEPKHESKPDAKPAATAAAMPSYSSPAAQHGAPAMATSSAGQTPPMEKKF